MSRAPLLAAVLVAALPARAGLPPRYGGEIAVALPAPPGELDPARAVTASDLTAARALHATLVEVDESGALRPALLAALPEAEPGARAFWLRLRPGLRFHGGQPVTAADVAASLSRLLSPAVRSPHGWIAAAVQGADAVREGRAGELAGVRVLSDHELRVALEIPFADFPRALAAAPAAVVPRDGPVSTGAGPFRLVAGAPGAGLRLEAFEGFHRGRPYSDRVSLAGLEARRAARALDRGELQLVLRPEAVPGAAAPTPLPAVSATWALLNRRRLGAEAEAARRALSDLDRAELARFARGPAVPLSGPLPPAFWPMPIPLAPAAPAPPSPPRTAGPRLSLLVAGGGESPRTVADRLQVKLFDRGLRVAVEVVPPEVFDARLAGGEYDLALVTRTLTASGAACGAVEVAWALGGPAAARAALRRLGSADPAAAAAAAAEEADAVPLLASGLVASAGPGLHGLAPLPDGGLDLGDLWTLPPTVAR